MTIANQPAVKPPRSTRVILGGMVAVISFFATLLFTAPDLHWAMISDSEPVEMTWADFVKDRDRSPTHLRLTAAGIETTDFAAHDIWIDTSAMPTQPVPSASPGLTTRLIDYVKTQTTESAFRDRVARFASVPPVEYLKVLPRGYTPDRTPAVVVVPLRQVEVETAVKEIIAGESLTGHFRRQQTSPMAARFAQAAGVTLPTPTFENQFVYEVPGTAPGLDVALVLFVVTATFFVLSLVWCCSGGPSIVACLFSPVQSVVSLLGYPLRYGRANMVTRLACLGVAGWIGWCGYHLAYETGGFGRVDGHVMEISVGMVAMLFAAAGLTGVLFSFLKRPQEDEFANPAGSAPAVIESDGVDPLAEILNATPKTRRYQNPKFEIPSAPMLSHEAEQASQTFERLQFDAALAVNVRHDQQQFTTTIQLGCENKVHARVEDRNGSPRTVLTTILSDGFIVISAPTLSPGLSQMEGQAGAVLLHKCNDVQTLLSAHLQSTIDIAESRQAEAVTQDASEWREVFRISCRVMAELRRLTQYESIEVGEGVHGRFYFPARPVEAIEPILV